MRSARQKNANDFGKQMGMQIRVHRLDRGMTQKQLGDGLGITFQQIAKYEHGTDRITCDRLNEIANLLEVAPGTFFPTAAGALTNVNGVVSRDEFMRLIDRDTISVLRALKTLRDIKRRQALIDMVLAYTDKYAIKARPKESAL
jgi:transcriptional regulator with XRE-family HTH domain